MEEKNDNPVIHYFTNTEQYTFYLYFNIKGSWKSTHYFIYLLLHKKIIRDIMK